MTSKRPVGPAPQWLRLGLLIALVILGFGWGADAFYRSQIQHLRHQVEGELTTINALKVHQLDAWRTERLGDGGVMMDSPFLIEAIASWQAAPLPALTERLLTRFRSLQTHYGYQDVLLVDAEGRIGLSPNGVL